ncbi:MAG TPA: AI-2E family transporter [Candidatus Paceibacterota bacterium]|nr:AI-2E family transporter [Candidatus Paceibacterota bacterium]
MNREQLRPYFLMILLLGVFGLVGLIFLPFLPPLILAAVFSVVLYPLYVRIKRRLGEWPSLASILTVLISLVIVLLPLSLLVTLVGNEARELYFSLELGEGRSHLSEVLLRFESVLGTFIPGVEGMAANIAANIDTYARTALQWVIGHAGSAFSSVASLLLSLFIFLLSLYYLLRDGRKLKTILVNLSPLNDKDDEQVFDRLGLAVNSVVKGSLAIALIQGALSAIGFTLFGVPSAILWGTLTALAALVPGIGTAVIFIPVIIYLFFASGPLPAIGLLLWGSLAVGLIDNLLGPKLIGRGMQLHPLLVLLSVLGGLVLFGPIGIFLGPLSVSFLFALLSIYAEASRV